MKRLRFQKKKKNKKNKIISKIEALSDWLISADH